MFATRRKSDPETAANIPESQPRDTSADVLITTTAFGGGGTERYVEDIAIGLAERNIKVVVLVDAGPLDRVRRLTSAGVPIQVLGSEPLKAPQYRWAFRAAVEHIRPRLIHVNAWAHHQDIIEVASVCRVPAIYTNHCTPRPPLLRERLGLNSVPFLLYRQRSLARHGGSAISISQLGLENLGVRLAHRVRSAVVYNGVPYVNVPKFGSGRNEALQIVWLGSLIKRKRPLLAIDVFKRVLNHHPEAQLAIIGDGPLLPDVLSAAKRLPPGAVQVKGFCNSVTDLIGGADVYLQTSADEGLPYSVLDAMSVGLPVVATDAGATREAVLEGKTGFLSGVNDISRLSQSLISLLNSPELRSSFGQEGLSRARTIFSLDRMLSETLSAYSTLCGVRI